ncbi:hypothetical protein Scep_002607 [Stephania cephalantha]|uniref:Uncharacterized protein n=1 Tax=Stephania cephalantha TaxID=152367 RepID=A0AAP0LAI7_9MAGN
MYHEIEYNSKEYEINDGKVNLSDFQMESYVPQKRLRSSTIVVSRRGSIGPQRATARCLTSFTAAAALSLLLAGAVALLAGAWLGVASPSDHPRRSSVALAAVVARSRSPCVDPFDGRRRHREAPSVAAADATEARRPSPRSHSPSPPSSCHRDCSPGRSRRRVVASRLLRPPVLLEPLLLAGAPFTSLSWSSLSLSLSISLS